MTDIRIDITSDTLTPALQRLVDSLGERSSLMLNVSEIMLAAVQENFIQGGRPAWLDTARGGQILRKSGRLFSSIQSSSNNNQALVGTNVVYAAIHNFGGEVKRKAGTTDTYHSVGKDGSFKKGFARRSKANFAMTHNRKASSFNMPQREFMHLTPNDENEIVDAINDYLHRALD